MHTACSDCDPNTARQSAHALAGTIRQRLGDMRATHVPQLLHLGAQLQSRVLDWDCAPLSQALGSLQSGGASIVLPPLRQGWFARLLGRERAAQAHFLTAFERMVSRASQVQTLMAGVTDAHRERVAEARRLLAEFDQVCESLNAGIDEGVTWLQAMCAHLADARPQDRGDDRLATLAEMAQFFTQEFKQLQALSARASAISVRSNSVLARQLALLEQARSHMAAFEQAWLPRVGGIAADLKAGRNARPALAKAIEAHDALMKRLSFGTDACGALQHEEHLLAHQLGMLERDIEGSDGR